MIRFLHSPVFADEEKTRKAGIFFRLVLGIVAIVSLMMIIALFVVPNLRTRWISVLLLLNTISYGLIYLNYKGHTRWASFAFILFSYSIIFILAWSAGGLKAAGIQLLPVFVVMASLVLGWKESILSAIIALIGGLVLALADRFAFLPVSIVTYSTLQSWIFLFMSIGLFTFLQFISYANLDTALNSAKRELFLRRTSESRIKSISNNFKAGMIYQVVIHPDHSRKFTYLSDSVRKLYGVSPEEGMRDANLIYGRLYEEDKPMVIKAEEEAIHSMSSFSIETRITDKSGALRWSSLVSTPRKLEDGSICFDGIEFIITEQKRIEATLRAERKLFRTIIDNIPDPIYAKDTRARKTVANLADVRNIGADSESDILNKDDFQLFPKPEAERFYAVDQSVIQTGKPAINIEDFFVNKAGKQVWLLSSKIPLHNERGEIIGLVGISRDITEMKIIEKELLKHKNDLELLVHERTDELAKTNQALNTTNHLLLKQSEELQAYITKLNETRNWLIQSEKMASLGLLSSGIAHELNNPLNFILGGSVALENYFADNAPKHAEQVSDILNAINVGVKRAAEIVASLNHYSRPEDLPKAECDLHAIADHCIIMLQNELHHRIELIKNYAAPVSSISGVEGNLHQAIFNILLNSIQSIENSGIINIFTRTEHDQFQMEIIDNGCGISEENLPKIFDPFFTTKDPGKGIGLGLSISLKIIREHNGTIDYESSRGTGTRVYIKFPLNPSS